MPLINILSSFIFDMSLCLSPQDTWMYPSVALFYPRLARAVLEYRVGTIEGARANAQHMGYKVQRGAILESSAALFTLLLFYQGLKYAWESAVTGRDVCPEDIYTEQELHINGDVVLAFQQYFYLTQVQTIHT